MEMVSSIIRQLTRKMTDEQIENSGFAPYFVDHGNALWPQSAGGIPNSATFFQSKGDPITDLTEDMAAEQKARSTYDNILRLVDDPEIKEPIKFLRAREIVHFQRFGEANCTHLKAWDDIRKKYKAVYHGTGGITVTFLSLKCPFDGQFG